MKTVSVHIVTYNSAQFIEACLESVLLQDYPIAQIIVVDNASRDATPDLLKSYGKRIKTLFNTVNQGFAGAHNQAIQLSESDYCLVLNPDVSLRPDYLSSLLFYNNQWPNVKLGSLTGKLLLKSNPELVDSCGLIINRARRAFDLGSGEPEGSWRESRLVFGVSGAAALYSRQMIRDISFQEEFFDNCFFAYKEDVDVAWRAQLFGWEAVFVPEAIAYHERGWKKGNRNKQTLYVRRLSYINRYKMILKNERIPWEIRNIWPLLVYECLSLGYVILREPRLLRAWSMFWRDWKKLKSWRTFIQSKTKGKSRKMFGFFKS